MKEVDVLILSKQMSLSARFKVILRNAPDVNYNIIHESGLREAKNYLDRHPTQVVIAEIAHPDGLQLLNDLNENNFNASLIALFEKEKAVSPKIIRNNAIQNLLFRDNLSPTLVRQTLLFARQRRHFQQLLAREQLLFKELMENSPDNIYFKDLNSAFVRVNKSMAESFGFENPEDLIGKTDFHLHPHDRAQEAYDDEQRIIKTGKTLSRKSEMDRRKDGNLCWVNTIKMPLHDINGEIIGTMGISRDVTEEKETAVKMEHIIEQLQEANQQQREAETSV